MRATLRFLAFPGLLGIAIILLVTLGRIGFDAVLATPVMWSLIFCLLVVLERLIPFERAWFAPDGQLAHDFAHTFLGSAVGSRLGALGADMVVAGVAAALPAISTIWPTSWPVWLQIAAAYAGLDLLRYWQHRVQHASGPLWETHKLHHDSRRLTTVKTGRSHPFDRAFQALCVVPLAMVGAPTSVLFYCVGLNSIIGLIGHANIDVRMGPLEFIFVGPPQHRVHHSVDPADHHSNFGASLTIWDRAFGTFRNREARTVGLEEATSPRLLGQLAAPINAWLGY